jgi:hypothetical protein
MVPTKSSKRSAAAPYKLDGTKTKANIRESRREDSFFDMTLFLQGRLKTLDKTGFQGVQSC